MSNENESEVSGKPGAAEAEAVPEPATAEAVPEPEPPKWEYKTNFAINERMKQIVGLTIEATQAEIARLRRKLDRLTYGS